MQPGKLKYLGPVLDTLLALTPRVEIRNNAYITLFDSAKRVSTQSINAH